MKVYFILIALLLCFFSCKNHNNERKNNVADMTLASPVIENNAAIGAKYNAYAPPQVAGYKNAVPKVVVDTAKKIIKEGEIRFQTGNLTTARDKIAASLKSFGGYISEESETNNSDNNQREYRLQVRIPAKNFDRFLDALSANADRVDTKNIRRKDVTTEFIDITTQLKNKQLLENRYLDLLKKATKTADLLEIEDKLTEIRTDIESTQGQLNYLSRQVAYNSLDITFYTRQTAQSIDDDFTYKFKTALVDGWKMLQNLFFGTVMFWPLIFLLIIAVVVFKRRKKRAMVKKNVQA